MRSISLIAMAAVCAACGSSGGDDKCRTAYVSCGYTLLARLSASLTELGGASVTACRNDQCFTGSLASGARTVRVTDANASWYADVSFSETAGAVTFSATWSPQTDSDLHDGDRYRLEITDAHGNQLLGYSEVVATYTVTSACGTTCRYAVDDCSAADAGTDGIVGPARNPAAPVCGSLRVAVRVRPRRGSALAPRRRGPAESSVEDRPRRASHGNV